MLKWLGIDDTDNIVSCLEPRPNYIKDTVDGHGGIRVLKVVSESEFVSAHDELDLVVYNFIMERSLLIMSKAKRYNKYTLTLTNNKDILEKQQIKVLEGYLMLLRKMIKKCS